MLNFKNKRISRLALTNAPLTSMTFLVIVLAFFARARINTQDISYLETTNGSLSPQDVMQLPSADWRVAPIDGMRYPTNKFIYRWNRFDVPATQGGSVKRYAEMFDPFQVSVDFYLLEGQRIIEHVVAGYDRDPSDTGTTGLSDAFAFRSSNTADRTLLLRTAARGRVVSSLQILDESEYHIAAKSRRAWLGILLGCTLGMTIYNIFLFAVTRDLGFLSYAAFMAAMAGEGAMLTGALRVFLPEVAKNLAIFSTSIQLLFLFGCAALIVFERQYCVFSLTIGRVRRLDNMILMSLAACVLPVLVAPIQFSTVFVVVAGTSLLLLKQIKMSRYLRHRRAVEFSVLVSSFIGTWMVSYAAWFGIIQRNLLLDNMYLIGSIVISCFFSSLLAVRQRQVEAKRKRIIMSLTRKNEVEGEGQAHRGESETSEVCIMFIDIVSFSQIAAPMPSRRVFTELSSRIRQISAVVASFGGSVDRSLGEGLLCFFGGEPGVSTRESAMNAFLAAIRLQELTVAEAMQPSTGRGRAMIMPLRIGVHSASVSVGNIGGEARIDFTMVGSGVNFARRLETACSPYKMIVSTEFRDQLLKAGVTDKGFSEIAITVKHQTKLVTACEFDPFYERPEVLREVERLYFEQLGVRSFDRIVDVRDDGAVRLESDYGSFVVRDFSLFGFRVAGKDLFGQNSLLKVKLVTDDTEVNRRLEEKLLDQLTVEVRWGRGSGDSFEHGLRIYGANKSVRNFLYDILRSRYGMIAESSHGADVFRDIA